MSTQHNHMVIIKTTQRMASLGPVYRWEHRPGRLSNFPQGNSAGQQHNKDAIQTVWPQSLSPCAFHHLPLERKEAQMRERQWKALLQPGGALVVMPTLFSESAEPKASTRVISGNLDIYMPLKPRHGGDRPQCWQQQLAGLCPHSWKWPT